MNFLKNGSKQFYLKIRFLAAQESENVKVTLKIFQSSSEQD